MWLGYMNQLIEQITGMPAGMPARSKPNEASPRECVDCARNRDKRRQLIFLGRFLWTLPMGRFPTNDNAELACDGPRNEFGQAQRLASHSQTPGVGR